MRLVRNVLSWALALVLIAIYVQTTIHPLSDPPAGMVLFFDRPGENILFATLAEKSGYPIWEPTGRVLTGLIELVAAFFLFWPFTRRFGALLSFLVMAAAVALHLSPWLGTEIPLSLRAEETATDGGGLFSLAIAALVASLLIILVHPGKKK